MNRPLYLIFFCLFFVVSVSHMGYAQDRHRLDSLLEQVKDETDHKKLAEYYYWIATDYYYFNPDSSLIYDKLYLEASKKANDSSWIADAYYWIADMYYYTDLDSALFYSDKYMEWAEALNDTLWIAYGYELYANVYYALGNIESALDYFRIALNYFSLVDNQFQIAACYNNMGYTITYGTDQSTGMSYFIKALQIAEEIKDTTLIADVSINIAYYYDKIRDFSSARRYYKRSLDLNLARNDSVAIAYSYAGIALVEIKTGNYKEAEYDMRNALNYICLKHKPDDLIDLYESVAECYIEWSKPDSARIYLDKAEKILDQFAYPMMKAYHTQLTGFLYFLKEDYRKCVTFLDRSLKQFEALNNYEPFAVTYAKLAEAYSALGMYEQAYNAQLMANAATDSMEYGEVAGLLNQMEQERLYQTALNQNRLEMELEAQRIENTSIQIRSNLRTAVIAIILLVLLAGIVVYFLITVRRKNAILEANNTLINEQKLLLEENIKKLELSEEELKELNATKDKFFSIIAHDLKNPFNSILGFSELFLRDKDSLKSENFIPIMESLNKTANYGFSLLENLLEWSLTQTGAISPKPEKISIAEILNQQVDYFNEIARTKNIKIEIQGESAPPVFADKNMVNTVIRNLLHNALKFSHDNSLVKIKLNRNDKYLITSIEDHGIGISEEDLNKLFLIESKIKKSGTDDQKGSGLGLILCKEFIEKNNGEIRVESQIQKGSKFSFSLPLFSEESQNP